MNAPNHIEELSDELQDHCWNRRGGILFRLQISADYHVERESHFDMCDKMVSTLVTFAATAAFVAVFGEHTDIGKGAAALASLASIAQVVFNPSSSARRHARLAAEFRQVMANARRTGEHWTPTQCDEFEARVAELEASEPAPMSAVVLECENRAALRAGKPPIVALPKLIRLVQHWWNFNPSVLMKNYGPKDSAA